jgi:hypothetical protein
MQVRHGRRRPQGCIGSVPRAVHPAQRGAHPAVAPDESPGLRFGPGRGVVLPSLHLRQRGPCAGDPRRLLGARLLSLDEGRPVTTEMVRQEIGHSASSRTIERIYARVQRRRERLDPFGFRIEEYATRPHVAGALARMGELISASEEAHQRRGAA